MVAELLPFVYVGDVYLHDGALQTADTVLQGDAGMGVGSGVQHDAVIGESHLLQLVDQFALDVALVVFNLHVGEFLFQFRKVALEGVAAIDAGFADTQ